MPDSLADLLAKADALLLGGDAEDALEVLKTAARLHPDDARLPLRQAEILISLGGEARLKQAWLALLKAIALGQRDAATYFLLLRTLVELDDLAGAQDAYDSALALEPDNARLREWGPRLAVLRGNPALALELVQVERQAAPDNVHWQRWEAELLLATGHVDAAKTALDILIATCPPEALHAGAWEAPQWAALFLARADAQRRLGMFDAAQADLDQAEALTPDDPAITFQRGLLAWAAGNVAQAHPLLQAGLDAAGPDVRAGFVALLADYPRRADLLGG